MNIAVAISILTNTTFVYVCVAKGGIYKEIPPTGQNRISNFIASLAVFYVGDTVVTVFHSEEKTG
jgi:hypothetical protein